MLHGLKAFATAARKWARPLTEFPTSRFQTVGWISQCTAGGGETHGASLASACLCTQGTSSYYTLIGRGTTAEVDCTSATRVLVIRSYTDARTGRIIYSPEFFSLILILILDYDYRLIDSTDCDKSRLRLYRKHIYIDILDL